MDLIPDLPPPPRPFDVVQPDIEINCVGREAELDSIEHAFERGSRRVILYGYPGIGKTVLANMFLERNRSHFPGGVLHVTGRNIEEAEDVRRIREGVFSNGPEKTLLVVDGLDELNQVYIRAALLEMLQGLPDTVSCVVSSRIIPNKVDFELIHVGGLNELAFRRLVELKQSLGSSPVDEAVIKELYHVAEGNPLFARLISPIMASHELSWPSF